MIKVNLEEGNSKMIIAKIKKQDKTLWIIEGSSETPLGPVKNRRAATWLMRKYGLVPLGTWRKNGADDVRNLEGGG